MELLSFGRAKSVSIEATIVRANGYKEDLGRIAYWDLSLIKRLGYKWRRSNGGLFLAAPVFAPHEHMAAAGLISLGAMFFAATYMTQAGEAIVTNLVSGLGGTAPKYVAWGTGAGTTARGDTSLFTEKAADLATGSGTRVTGTPTQQTVTNTNDTIQIVGTIVATGAGTVTNGGLFDGSTIGSNNLFMKGDFTGLPLGVSDSITFTDKVTFTD